MFTCDKVWFWPLQTILCHLCVHRKDRAAGVPGQYSVALDVRFTHQSIHLLQLCVCSDMAQSCIIHLPLQETHCPGLQGDLGNVWVLLKKHIFSLFLFQFLFLPICVTLLIAFWVYRTSQGKESCTVQFFCQSLHSSITHLHCQGIIIHRTVWNHLNLHAFQSAFVSDYQNAI